MELIRAGTDVSGCDFRFRTPLSCTRSGRQVSAASMLVAFEGRTAAVIDLMLPGSAALCWVVPRWY